MEIILTVILYAITFIIGFAIGGLALFGYIDEQCPTLLDELEKDK